MMDETAEEDMNCYFLRQPEELLYVFICYIINLDIYHIDDLMQDCANSIVNTQIILKININDGSRPINNLQHRYLSIKYKT